MARTYFVPDVDVAMMGTSGLRWLEEGPKLRRSRYQAVANRQKLIYSTSKCKRSICESKKIQSQLEHFQFLIYMHRMFFVIHPAAEHLQYVCQD